MKDFLVKILNLLPDEKDRFNYQGWLVSESLGKRALAIVGHYLVGYFIITFITLIVVFFLIFIFAFLGISN